MIKITSEEIRVTDCVSAIIVPETALREAGYIKTMTVKADAHAKHEFHALAQMAYFQYQDDELAITTFTKPLSLEEGDALERLDSGMLIYRDSGGEFHVLIAEGVSAKKILEACYRYCTRWVRLDI